MKVSWGAPRIWFFLSVLLFLAGCAPKQPGMVRDIQVLPQDVNYYIDDDPGRLLINAEKQDKLYQDFLERFYMPWNRAAPKFKASEVFWGLDLYRARDIYSENKLPFVPGWIGEMEQNSDIQAYPSLHIPAISVTHASMRVLPTRRPVFYDPQRPGEGFPFDYMQNTLLPAGTPLLVTHVSRDGQWAMTETDFAAGWIRWHDLAVVDDNFKRMYQDKALLGFVSDDVPVTREDGMFAVSGRVGMALPLALEQGDTDLWRVLVPVRDHLGQAKIISARVAKSNAREMPFSPSQKNFADILNSMMGQAYGWGGLFENPDCSALIRDAVAG
ncbi:MAG: NlpC/P60 family N-terminal domain-containing protein, partial [Desulfonatronovibrio sp.]